MMTRPHEVLIRFAVDGEVAGDLVDDIVIDSAIEHRVALLLLAALREEPQLSRPALIRLEAFDLVWLHRRQAALAVLTALRERLDSAGIGHVFMKGPVDGQRYFGDVALRPFVDIDLAIHPTESLTRTIALFDPDHPQLGDLDRLAERGYLRAVTIDVDDQSVDVHVDPLRVGPASKYPPQWHHRLSSETIPGVGPVPVLDDEASMLSFLINQGRDRFRYLVGVMEFRRRLARPVDWDGVRDLAEGEGLWDQAAAAAAVLASLSRRDLPFDPPSTRLYELWLRLWSDHVVLAGHEGRFRHVRRADWLMPLLARRRHGRALWWIFKSAVPPDPVMKMLHPDARGPYPWRLLAARLRVYRARRLGRLRSPEPVDGHPAAGRSSDSKGN